MGSTQRSSDSDSVSRVQKAGSTIRETVFAPIFEVFEPVLQPIIDSVLLKLATLGVIFLVLGAVINEGVWAAVLATWGGGLMLIGFGFYGLIWIRRR